LSNYAFTNVATLKYAFDIYNLKAKLGNQHLNYEIEVEPKELNTSDKSFSAKHSVKYEPATSTFEATHGLKYGSPSVGPARFWATVSIFSSNYLLKYL
jgi:hypothetical protein